MALMRWIFCSMCLCVFSGCLSLPVKKAVNNKTELLAVEIVATQTSFDAKTGIIKYTLPEDALVRLRVGVINNGPLLRTLIDSDKRIKGPHIEKWDLKDASGQIDFHGRKDLMLVLKAFPVTENNVSSSARIDVTFPDAKERSPEGWPILSGISAIRVGLNKEDKLRLSSSKYEVGLFMDCVFLMEDEEGTDPFTYKINTVNLSNGEHLITSNVIGYNGDIGTQSARVVVKN